MTEPRAMQEKTVTDPPTAADSPLVYALNLGWRIAHLYALTDDFEAPLDDTLLPLHHSLAGDDQLELQVLAAAGDARRAEIGACAEALDGLRPLARDAAGSDERCEEFRRQLRATHIAIDKELWARREADGKAYELGNGLSDTYNRICRAYRDPTVDTARVWREVFDKRRIERLKTHLHDLQSRLDSRGVTVVSEHLDAWCDRVAAREGASAPAPSQDETRKFLRRQTTTWRQLLAGDKEPEAYLDRDQRAKVRNELGRMVWKRYVRWLPAAILVVAGVFTAAVHAPDVADWYADGEWTGLAVTLVASVAGALGITQASVGLTIRTRVCEWTELLWSRALSKRVTDVTLLVDDLLPDPSRPKLIEVTAQAGHRAGAKASALRGRTSRSRAPAGADSGLTG